MTPPSKPAAAPASPVLASANDTFEYRVGNEHFSGRTIVRVVGDGSAEASFERGGKLQSYKGTVPAATMAALRTSLTKHPLESYKPKARDAVPDEGTIEMTLVTGGTRSGAKILDNDRYDIEPLGDLVEVINEIASKVSGGKITY